MKKLLAVLALCFCGSAFADWTPHWDARAAVIGAHQDIAGNQSVMTLGDSITESQGWWNYVNGCRMINAGLGGITAKALAERINTVYGSPRYVLIMIGTNTANVGIAQSDVDAFGAHLQTIIQNLLNRGSRPILVSIPPVGKYQSSFSQSRVNYLNGFVVALASQYGLLLVNLNYSLMDLNQYSPTYGYALPSMISSDGVHLTRAAHVAMYYAYEAALQNQIAATGVPCTN